MSDYLFGIKGLTQQDYELWERTYLNQLKGKSDAEKKQQFKKFTLNTRYQGDKVARDKYNKLPDNYKIQVLNGEKDINNIYIKDSTTNNNSTVPRSVGTNSATRNENKYDVASQFLDELGSEEQAQHLTTDQQRAQVLRESNRKEHKLQSTEEKQVNFFDDPFAYIGNALNKMAKIHGEYTGSQHVPTAIPGTAKAVPYDKSKQASSNVIEDVVTKEAKKVQQQYTQNEDQLKEDIENIKNIAQEKSGFYKRYKDTYAKFDDKKWEELLYRYQGARDAFKQAGQSDAEADYQALTQLQNDIQAEIYHEMPTYEHYGLAAGQLASSFAGGTASTLGVVGALINPFTYIHLDPEEELNWYQNTVKNILDNSLVQLGEEVTKQGLFSRLGLTDSDFAETGLSEFAAPDDVNDYTFGNLIAHVLPTAIGQGGYTASSMVTGSILSKVGTKSIGWGAKGFAKASKVQKIANSIEKQEKLRKINNVAMKLKDGYNGYIVPALVGTGEGAIEALQSQQNVFQQGSQLVENKIEELFGKEIDEEARNILYNKPELVAQILSEYENKSENLTNEDIAFVVREYVKENLPQYKSAMRHVEIAADKAGVNNFTFNAAINGWLNSTLKASMYNSHVRDALRNTKLARFNDKMLGKLGFKNKPLSFTGNSSNLTATPNDIGWVRATWLNVKEPLGEGIEEFTQHMTAATSEAGATSNIDTWLNNKFNGKNSVVVGQTFYSDYVAAAKAAGESFISPDAYKAAFYGALGSALGTFALPRKQRVLRDENGVPIVDNKTGRIKYGWGVNRREGEGALSYGFRFARSVVPWRSGAVASYREYRQEVIDRQTQAEAFNNWLASESGIAQKLRGTISSLNWLEHNAKDAASGDAASFRDSQFGKLVNDVIMLSEMEGTQYYQAMMEEIQDLANFNQLSEERKSALLQQLDLSADQAENDNTINQAISNAQTALKTIEKIKEVQKSVERRFGDVGKDVTSSLVYSEIMQERWKQDIKDNANIKPGAVSGFRQDISNSVKQAIIYGGSRSKIQENLDTITAKINELKDKDKLTEDEQVKLQALQKNKKTYERALKEFGEETAELNAADILALPLEEQQLLFEAIQDKRKAAYSKSQIKAIEEAKNAYSREQQENLQIYANAKRMLETSLKEYNKIAENPEEFRRYINQVSNATKRYYQTESYKAIGRIEDAKDFAVAMENARNDEDCNSNSLFNSVKDNANFKDYKNRAEARAKYHQAMVADNEDDITKAQMSLLFDWLIRNNIDITNRDATSQAIQDHWDEISIELGKAESDNSDYLDLTDSSQITQFFEKLHQKVFQPIQQPVIQSTQNPTSNSADNASANPQIGTSQDSQILDNQGAQDQGDQDDDVDQATEDFITTVESVQKQNQDQLDSDSQDAMVSIQDYLVQQSNSRQELATNLQQLSERGDEDPPINGMSKTTWKKIKPFWRKIYNSFSAGNLSVGHTSLSQNPTGPSNKKTLTPSKIERKEQNTQIVSFPLTKPANWSVMQRAVEYGIPAFLEGKPDDYFKNKTVYFYYSTDFSGSDVIPGVNELVFLVIPDENGSIEEDGKHYQAIGILPASKDYNNPNQSSDPDTIQGRARSKKIRENIGDTSQSHIIKETKDGITQPMQARIIKPRRGNSYVNRSKLQPITELQGGFIEENGVKKANPDIINRIHQNVKHKPVEGGQKKHEPISLQLEGVKRGGDLVGGANGNKAGQINLIQATPYETNNGNPNGTLGQIAEQFKAGNLGKDQLLDYNGRTKRISGILHDIVSKLARENDEELRADSLLGTNEISLFYMQGAHAVATIDKDTKKVTVYKVIGDNREELGSIDYTIDNGQITIDRNNIATFLADLILKYKGTLDFKWQLPYAAAYKEENQARDPNNPNDPVTVVTEAYEDGLFLTDVQNLKGDIVQFIFQSSDALGPSTVKPSTDNANINASDPEDLNLDAAMNSIIEESSENTKILLNDSKDWEVEDSELTYQKGNDSSTRSARVTSVITADKKATEKDKFKDGEIEKSSKELWEGKLKEYLENNGPYPELATLVFNTCAKLGIRFEQVDEAFDDIDSNGKPIKRKFAPGRFILTEALIQLREPTTELTETLSRAGISWQDVILHEALHAVTVYALNNPQQMSEDVQNIISDLQSIYKELAQKPELKLKKDGGTEEFSRISNVKEMVAELSNPKFREYLREIKQEQTVIQKFKSFLVSIFKGKKSEPNLEQVVSKAVNKLILNFDREAYLRILGGNQDVLQGNFTRSKYAGIPSAIGNVVDGFIRDLFKIYATTPDGERKAKVEALIKQQPQISQDFENLANKLSGIYANITANGGRIIPEGIVANGTIKVTKEDDTEGTLQVAGTLDLLVENTNDNSYTIIDIKTSRIDQRTRQSKFADKTTKYSRQVSMYRELLMQKLGKLGKDVQIKVQLLEIPVDYDVNGVTAGLDNTLYKNGEIYNGVRMGDVGSVLMQDPINAEIVDLNIQYDKLDPLYQHMCKFEDSTPEEKKGQSPQTPGIRRRQTRGSGNHNLLNLEGIASVPIKSSNTDVSLSAVYIKNMEPKKYYIVEEFNKLKNDDNAWDLLPDICKRQLLECV